MWYSNEKVVVMLSVDSSIIHLGAPAPDEGIVD
jgi:hypothetical protein